MTFQTEWMAGGPVFHNISDQSIIIMILQPLFEEANRVRRTLAQMCRHIEDHGIGVAVPDLPGMGEHQKAAADATFAQMTNSVENLADHLSNRSHGLFTAGFRAGCLFDDITRSNGTWRFSPEAGDRLVRTMMRTETPEDSDESVAFVQGQHVSRALLADLSIASLCEPAMLRTVRLSTDRAPADLYVDASPLWRHAEPGEDPMLAKLLANDLIHWVRTCAAS